MSTTAKINKLIRNTVGRPAKILWVPTGIGNSQTLNVITSAWRKLSPNERAIKLESALDPSLTRKERASIFYTSVLTPAEFKRLAQMLPERVLYGRFNFNGQKRSRRPSRRPTSTRRLK